MLTPINPIKLTNQALRPFQPEIKPNECHTDSELCSYQAGMALRAMSGVSFKNLSKPVEITHLYNKKVEGKEHLDLPNVHVYEFSDTNLRVFVNADENVITDEESFLNPPQIMYTFKNNMDLQERNLIKEEKIKEILKEKTNFISQNLLTNVAENKFFSYSQHIGENVIDNLNRYNSIIYNLDTENKDLQQYYSKMINNLSVQVFVTVSKDYFNENKKELLEGLNKGLRSNLIKNDNHKNICKEEILKDISLSIINSYCGENYQDILEMDLEDILNQTKTLYKQELKEFLTGNRLPLVKNAVLAKYESGVFSIYETINSISETEVKKFVKGVLDENYKNS